jgi:DNA segregation ATPase FtsK/SpoIIIE-like protein
MKIDMLLDLHALQNGKQRYIPWNPERHPMLLIVGGTGAGKSYHLKLLMGKIVLSSEDSTIFLCDFKDIDFRNFMDTPRRWSLEACADGLEAFYDSFQARLSGADKSTGKKFLVFDEWAAFCLSRPDKKEQERVKSMLSTLLMMGRGVQHHVIIGLQRADSQLFPLGGRDQFLAILALGNISKEQKMMLFPDSREEMDATNDRGQGYLSLDGEPLRRVQVPTVTNFPKLNAAIRAGLTR